MSRLGEEARDAAQYPQHIGQSPTRKTCPVPHVSSAVVEKPCPILIQEDTGLWWAVWDPRQDCCSFLQADGTFWILGMATGDTTVPGHSIIIHPSSHSTTLVSTLCQSCSSHQILLLPTKHHPLTLRILNLLLTQQTTNLHPLMRPLPHLQ